MVGAGSGIGSWDGDVGRPVGLVDDALDAEGFRPGGLGRNLWDVGVPVVVLGADHCRSIGDNLFGRFGKMEYLTLRVQDTKKGTPTRTMDNEAACV